MPPESYRILNFFDWSHGIRDRRVNPLAFPQNAIMAGENVEIADNGLKTRGGTSLTSSGSLPRGEVMALAQVRFPSNETSYLVAQVSDATDIIVDTTEQDSAPEAMRILMSVALDTQNGYIWVYGGESPTHLPPNYSDLWYFDIDNKTWHEVTDDTGRTPYGLHGGDMIYDPVAHRLIYFGGVWQGIHPAIRWRAFDIETRAWSDLTVTGETFWDDCPWSFVYFHRLLYRSATHSVIFMGGTGCNQPTPVSYVEVDLATLTAQIKTAGSGPTTEGHDAAWFSFGAHYNELDDTIAIVSPEGRQFWVLDCSTTIWTQYPLLPEPPTTPSAYGLIRCNDTYYVIGQNWESGDPFPTAMLWGFDGEGWAAALFEPHTPAIIMSYPIIDGSDTYLVCGLTFDAEGNYFGVSGASAWGGVCSFVPTSGGLGGAVPQKASRLYASNDHLPASNATFAQIYNLGDADRVSFAVLNDRVVITEGKAAPPLVWGGCMSDDGSDWMYPKAVLVSQDGEHFYDVSAQVLDKDVDNVADIGLISANGYLAVCTDMPNVQGFYFEMETPNTVDTELLGNQRTCATVLSSDAGLVVEDLKGIIANWVQDSGSSGHFTDSGNNPVTLGNGNDCPHVEEGLDVIFSTNQATIVSVTGNGSGTGSVTISATLSSQGVEKIVGLSGANGSLTALSGYSPILTTWSKTPGTGGFAGSGFSIRQIVSASEIAHSGDYFRISIKLGTPTGIIQGELFSRYNGVLRGSSNHPLEYVIAQKMYSMISRISIGERDGSSANTVETPTPITFPYRPYWDKASGDYSFATHPSFTTSDDHGTVNLAVCTVHVPFSSLIITSDWIKFDIDDTKDYILIFDFMDVWNGNFYRGNTVSRSSGAGYYFLSGTANAPQTWNVADVSEHGFSFQEGLTLGAIEIQVKDRFPLPTQLLVAHTDSDSMVDISGMEKLRIVSPSQNSVGSTHVYHAVSLDANQTFRVYKNASWRVIVRESASAWQYLDGSGTWQIAPDNTALGALKQAMAVSANQMSAAELAAIDADGWTSPGGVILHVTQKLSLAVGMLCDSQYAPTVTSYTVTYNDAGDTAIQGYSGDKWTSGEGFRDNTRLDDVPWGQSGTIMYEGDKPFQSQYYVLNEVPGYWFRFKSNGTAQGTSITRVLYKAPCQPLANLGDGQPDIPLAMIFHDTSKDAKKDITIEVSGAQGSFTTDQEGDVTYTAGKATLPMETGDYLYVGYVLKFNQIEISPYDDFENAANATLSAEYWNGSSWIPLDIIDGTAGEDEEHPKAFSTKGKITWFLPPDWKMHIPLNADFPRGYYVRFSVSAKLTATTSIDEVRVYAVPDALVKHKFAVSFRDRIALVSRPDAADQVDISRALEEYGFSGADSGSYRVGGMDSVQCAVSAWNGLFLGKTESWHQLLGQTPENFGFESVEAARHIPLNSAVIVKAPVAGIDSGTRYGLFYINRFGAFVSTGLHTDTEWNTGRGAPLSDAVKWWDGEALPRLDLNNLHRACGEYWPVKNWIVWAVPMIAEQGQTSQTTNNRLIIFDVALGAWLPPFTISVASLAAAYHYHENAPGKLGEMGLYAGDYQGRIIRLFGSEDTTDLGQPISAWLETGWLHLGSPEWVKLIRRLQIYGHNAAGNPIIVKLWSDGNADPDIPTHTLCLDDLDAVDGAFFSREEESLNVQARFVKLRLEFQDVTQIFGIQIGTSLIREWGAS